VFARCRTQIARIVRTSLQTPDRKPMAALTNTFDPNTDGKKVAPMRRMVCKHNVDTCPDAPKSAKWAAPCSRGGSQKATLSGPACLCCTLPKR
jgi:hypothetical protein